VLQFLGHGQNIRNIRVTIIKIVQTANVTIICASAYDRSINLAF